DADDIDRFEFLAHHLKKFEPDRLKRLALLVGIRNIEREVAPVFQDTMNLANRLFHGFIVGTAAGVELADALWMARVFEMRAIGRINEDEIDAFVFQRQFTGVSWNNVFAVRRNVKA